VRGFSVAAHRKNQVSPKHDRAVAELVPYWQEPFNVLTPGGWLNLAHDLVTLINDFRVGTQQSDRRPKSKEVHLLAEAITVTEVVGVHSRDQRRRALAQAEIQCSAYS